MYSRRLISFNQFNKLVFPRNSNTHNAYCFKRNNLRSVSSINSYSTNITNDNEQQENLLHLHENPDMAISLEDNGIRVIKFNRPEKKNAITKDMAFTFLDALKESELDENTVLTVVTGEGDYFTSGMDMSKPDPLKVQKYATQKFPVNDLVTTLIDLKKPIVALVNGPAIGVGVTMLGLFDTVYASTNATFLAPFVRYGLPPEFCSTYTFPRIMGSVKANELLTFSIKKTGKEMFEAGLVSHLFSEEQFPSEAWRKIQEIGTLPSKSLMHTKELIRGPLRDILYKAHRAEQEKFSIETARVVKEAFVKRKHQFSYFVLCPILFV